jgi:hypothetical protein
MFRSYALIAVAMTVISSLSLAQESTPGSQSALSPSGPQKDSVTASESAVGPDRSSLREVAKYPYIPAPREQQPRSPGGRITRGRYTSIQVNVDANGNNIVGDAANESSIAVNPTNPRNMVIGWRQFDTVASDFRQAGWAYTTNGGQTWTFPGVIDPGHFRSDPVVDTDRNGIFYYNSLTNEGGYQCKVFKSTNGGVSWDGGVPAYGGDKQWQTIDKTTGVGSGNIYASWNEIYSACTGHFTRSTNGGTSFEPCISAPSSPYWGTLAVGPDGELYLSGEGFIVDKSVNAKIPGSTITWTSASVNLGGSIVSSGGPNPGGLLGQAWVDVDRSTGPTRGYVYLMCSVDPAGSDPLDVMFSRSTDGGTTWSAPVRINDDPVGNGAWHWFATMSVAPNGRIDVIWNDTRNNPGGYLSELYYSYSTNAGVTWSANEVLTPAWDPSVGYPQQNKIGDYYDMTSDDRGANLAFAATFNGEQDVYYLRLGDPYCTDAGTVTLNKPEYKCADTLTITVLDCGLNTNDQQIETTTVTVASTTEPAGETVILTETDPGSAQFVGSIPLSTTNASGVLQVAEGDTVTVTYIDADNGQGGTNVTVTAMAPVDCTPPTISNVQTTAIQAHSATVSFTTNEAARGIVHYGLSCGNLNLAASGAFSMAPTVALTGLTHSTTYFYSVEAEDLAGNAVTDNNGGTCYTFTTPAIPDYFTQLFTTDNDLDNLSLKFTTGNPTDFYSGCAEPITSLPTDPAGGTTISSWTGSADDGNAQITLTGGATVKLYGQSYSSFWVGTNGYITFTSGDTTYTESYSAHFNQPRISALFNDLDAGQGGSVSWKQLADRAVVTWLNIPHHNVSNQNTFQIEMFFDGKITIDYLAIADLDGLAGLSAGGGQPADFTASDLSTMGTCGPKPPTANNVSATTPLSTPVTVTLTATDDGLPNPPAALSYIISVLPAHGSLSDPNGGAIASVPYTLLSNGNHVVYTPVVDYRPSDTFKFKANDGGTPPEGGDSNEATATIGIGGSAFDPVAHDVSQSVPASAPSNITLNATDPNSDPLTYYIQSLPLAGLGLLFDPNGGQITTVPYALLSGGKIVKYIPPFNQALTASFTYSAKDATAMSNTATVSLTVGAAVSQLVHEYPMNTNPGWSTTGLWAFGQPTGGGSHNKDPLSGHIGTNVYGYNLTGDYTKSMPARYLTTTAISCANVTGAELKFWRWLGVDAPAYAKATIEVSTNGTTWTQVWQNPMSVADTAWLQQTYNISAVADNQPTVYLRWTMGPTTSNATTYPGWNIDDVEIWGVVHNTCTGVVAGDLNGDSVANGLDIQRFVQVLLDPYASGVTFPEFCAADMNADGFVTMADVDLFVDQLVGP